METATTKRSVLAARIHLAGDVVAIALFVVLGMSEHRSIASLGAVLRNLAIFAGSWSLWSWVFKLYRSPAGEKAISPRFALTWITAITSGIAVRGVLLGRSIGRGQLLFWVAAMVATGTFLFGWRLVYAGIRTLRSKQSE